MSVARWPILSRCFSTVTPGASIGTMNAERPRWPFVGSVFAKTTVHAAWPAFVMNVFEPLRTYSSPRRSAFVLMRATSEPASGSVSPNEHRSGSSASGGSHVALLLVVAGDDDRRRAERVRDDRDGDPGAAPRELLADQHPREAGQARAAVLLREVDVHQADLVRLRDHVGRMRRVLVVLGGLRADLLLGELARQLAQRLLLVAERERDAAVPLFDRRCRHCDPPLTDQSVNSVGRYGSQRKPCLCSGR